MQGISRSPVCTHACMCIYLCMNLRAPVRVLGYLILFASSAYFIDNLKIISSNIFFLCVALMCVRVTAWLV